MCVTLKKFAENETLETKDIKNLNDNIGDTFLISERLTYSSQNYSLLDIGGEILIGKMDKHIVIFFKIML